MLALFAGFILPRAIHAQSAAPTIPTFPIVRIVVSGNTLLPQPTVDAAVAPFIGPRKDFGDVQKAVEALEDTYKRAGLTSVSVLLPEQVLERGEVRLNVIESRIKEVRVSGQQHFDTENIRASLPGITEGAIPQLDDISASLRVANENPFKKVKLQMQPGQNDQDINAVVSVTDELPLKMGLTLDNTGTPQTGRSRLGFSFQHGNLFNRDQILTLQYQTSPDKLKDVNVYALAYRLPLYTWGDVIDIYATKSDVNAGLVAAGPFNLAITGKGTSLGAKYTRKLKRRGDYDHELVFGLDEKIFKNSISATGVELGTDVAVRPLTATYAGRLVQEARELSVNLGLTYNLGAGSNGDQAAITKSRLGASREYSVLRGGLTFSQALTNDWQWRFVTYAQWAAKPLIPGEQFGVGGAASVRGFLEREIANDKGIQGNLELYSPELCAKSFPGQQCRVVGFYDFGALYRNQPQLNEDARENVASVGLGLRWTVSKDLAVQADYANILNGTTAHPSGHWRFHGRVGWFF
jgi:hemolysin activation/secretion protein